MAAVDFADKVDMLRASTDSATIKNRLARIVEATEPKKRWGKQTMWTSLRRMPVFVLTSLLLTATGIRR